MSTIWMRAQAARFAVAAALALGCTSLHGQAAGTSGSGSSVDAALLSKASAGDAGAQVTVGESYARAAAAEQDPDASADDWKQVVAWYTKAANQGSLSGELHLAALYRDGAGKAIARDMSQAAAWYRKAADQGDTGAQGTLGLLYAMGQGLPRSDADAYFWLDLAASTPGPQQAQYAANRQMAGMRLTMDDLDAIHTRERRWKAAHSRH